VMQFDLFSFQFLCYLGINFLAILHLSVLTIDVVKLHCKHLFVIGTKVERSVRPEQVGIHLFKKFCRLIFFSQYFFNI
jgi:hypothetical protein